MMLDVTQGEIEREVKRALPACGDLATCHPLIKGHGHQSFVLETSSNAQLLLKIALRIDQLGKMRALRHALELVAEHGIATPRLLHFSEGTSSFAGRPWMIQEFLTGQDGEEAIAGMSELQRVSFFHDFGKAVSRLHAVSVGFFSENLAGSRPEPTWASLVESRLERLTATHLQAGLLPRKSLESARQAIISVARAISSEVRPSLVHWDLYLANTLAAAGRFQCLLDFEHARSADALSDFVKLKMWMFDVVPGSESAFSSGYGSNPLITEQGRIRYDLALGLELLSGLLYWKRTGEEAMLADYQGRFGHWLAQTMAHRVV